MRTIAMLGALAVFAATPAAAQGKFRTGDINPARGTPTTSGGQVLGGVLGQRPATDAGTLIWWSGMLGSWPWPGCASSRAAAPIASATTAIVTR